MAASVQPIPPLPIPTEPLVDLRTGHMNRNWFQYFRAMDSFIRDMDRRITDLETP